MWLQQCIETLDQDRARVGIHISPAVGCYNHSQAKLRAQIWGVGAEAGPTDAMEGAALWENMSLTKIQAKAERK